jgi:hypothetical protein
LTQLNLFAAIRQPPVMLSVNVDGPVLQTEPDLTITLPHPRMAWDRARLEIHRHTNGLWMWSASFQIENQSASYRVGEKWGKFASTKSDAIFYAVEELESKLTGHSSDDAKRIRDWLITIKIKEEGMI